MSTQPSDIIHGIYATSMHWINAKYMSFITNAIVKVLY